MASSHQSASASRHPDGHSRHDAVRSGTRTLKTKNKFPEFARAPFQDQLHCQTPIPCGTWEVEISSHTYHSSLDLAPYTAYEGQGTKPTALFPKTPLHPEFRLADAGSTDDQWVRAPCPLTPILRLSISDIVETFGHLTCLSQVQGPSFDFNPMTKHLRQQFDSMKIGARTHKPQPQLRRVHP